MSPQTTAPPALAAELVNGQLRVFCPACRRNHYHGDGGGFGHRVAHCTNPASPYRQTGYLLVRQALAEPPRTHP